MDGGKVKGCVILGYMDFVRETWGQDDLDKLLADMEIDFEIRKGVEYHLKLVTWFHSWIADNKGEEHIENAGKHAIANLSNLAYIVNHLDIKTILKFGPQKYRAAFSEGEINIKLNDSSANVVINGNDPNDPYANKAWIGVFKGMLDITHTAGTVKEIHCENEEAGYCEFLIEWKTIDPLKKSSRLR